MKQRGLWQVFLLDWYFLLIEIGKQRFYLISPTVHRWKALPQGVFEPKLVVLPAAGLSFLGHVTTQSVQPRGGAYHTQKRLSRQVLLSTWLAILVWRHQPTGTLESSCMNKVWQTPNFVINEWVSTLKSHYNPFKYPDKIQAGLPSMFLQLGKKRSSWALQDLKRFKILKWKIIHWNWIFLNFLISMGLMQSKAESERAILINGLLVENVHCLHCAVTAAQSSMTSLLNV